MFGLLPYFLAAATVAGIWAWDRTTILSLRDRVTSLQEEIDNPMTGWRRQLAVCISNSDMFTMQIEIVDGKITELGRKTDDVIEAQARLGRQARDDGKRLREEVSDILTRPITGETTCERALTIQRAPLFR